MVAFEPHQIDALKALALGFAFAGFAFNAFWYVTERPPSFGLLNRGGWGAVLFAPLVATTAPFIILRNTVRGRRFERRSLIFVWLATVIACLWGMAAGAAMMRLASLFVAG
jgi:hypothetical protein